MWRRCLGCPCVCPGHPACGNNVRCQSGGCGRAPTADNSFGLLSPCACHDMMRKVCSVRLATTPLCDMSSCKARPRSKAGHSCPAPACTYALRQVRRSRGVLWVPMAPSRPLRSTSMGSSPMFSRARPRTCGMEPVASPTTPRPRVGRQARAGVSDGRAPRERADRHRVVGAASKGRSYRRPGP